MYLVDSGLHFADPYPMFLMTPQRAMDILLSFETAGRDTDDGMPFWVFDRLQNSRNFFVGLSNKCARSLNERSGASVKTETDQQFREKTTVLQSRYLITQGDITPDKFYFWLVRGMRGQHGLNFPLPIPPYNRDP